MQKINKTFIITEVGSNYNNDLETAKKYIEISLSGSIICGDFPSLDNNIFSDCMCIINNIFNMIYIKRFCKR